MGLGALERGAGSFVVHRQSKGDVVALQRSSGAAGRRASTPRSAKSPERSDLALGDREDDHDLVRPGGMDRQVDRRDVREGLLHRSIERLPLCEEPLSTTKWTRRAALAGLGRHHLVDKAHERLDAGLLGPSPKSTARCTPTWAPRWAACRPGDARTRRLGGPRQALAGVEDMGGLLGGVRVASQDPGSTAPGLDRRCMQPAPNRRGRIASTRPSVIARAARSCELLRVRGSWRQSGGSQATAPMLATTSPEKRRGRPERLRSDRPRALLRTGACATSRRRQPDAHASCDLDVGDAICAKERDARPEDLTGALAVEEARRSGALDHRQRAPP